MPRLNNQDELVIETYDLTVHWDDPGQDPPVDLCDECAASWLDADLCIEHPSYGDDAYRCHECGTLLTEQDDWFD